MGRKEHKEPEITRIRRDILESGARCFARKGYHETSMDEIAREVGCAVGSLYNYFPSKAKLYTAVLDMISDEVDAVDPNTVPEVAALPFSERIEWLIRQIFALLAERREFVVAFLAEHGHFDWHLGRSVGGVARKQYARLTAGGVEIMEGGIAEGALKPADPRDLAYFFVGAVNTTIFRWFGGELEGPIADYVPRLVDQLLNGIGAEGVRQGQKER